MLFYFSVVGVALVTWLIYSTISGVPPVLNISILGIFAIVLLLLGIRRGYMRGRWREIIFVASVIFLYGAKGFIREQIVNFFNLLRGLVVSQLLNRGISQPELNKGNWNPDAAARTNMEIMIFFVGVVLAYVITSSLKGGKGRDVFGAIIGGLSMLLFMNYAYALLNPFLKPILDNRPLEGAKIALPTIRLPEISIRNGQGWPFAGWNAWLPVAVVILITVYIVFFTFLNPPQKKGKLDIVTVALTVVLLLLVWFFAVQRTA